MEHYRVAILVLAPNNNEIYKNYRKIWKQYMNVDPTIKVYFVYRSVNGRLSEPLNDYDDGSDIIIYFNDIPDSYSVLVEKTVRGMKHIDSTITYDFLIVTNLSTFWDFKKLHIHLDELPKSNCYSGYGLSRMSDVRYLCGTHSILTQEMLKAIITNDHLVDYNLVEDAPMGYFFQHELEAPLLPNRMFLYTSEDLNPEFYRVLHTNV